MTALRNVTVVPHDSSSIVVSWLPPIDPLTYTYAVVIFDAISLRAINTFSDTFTVVDDLVNLETYLILVVAMSGDMYSANYRLFTLGMLLHVISGT